MINLYNSSPSIKSTSPLHSQAEETKKQGLLACALTWRQKKLWVKPAKTAYIPALPALQSQEWIVDCLTRSAVEQVYLDPKLGVTKIQMLADACAEANKPVFLRIPTCSKSLVRQCSPRWRVKRLLDWIVALLLLLGLSPVLCGLALLVKISSPGPVLDRQWRVGKRGKLFQLYQFRTSRGRGKQEEGNPQLTAVGQWLEKFHLEELPQLFNVLQGEMSLVGLRPRNLSDVLRLSASQRKWLTVLPGMVGVQQVQELKPINWQVMSQFDSEYIQKWSLSKDVGILLRTIPRLISGLGAS